MIVAIVIPNRTGSKFCLVASNGEPVLLCKDGVVAADLYLIN